MEYDSSFKMCYGCSIPFADQRRLQRRKRRFSYSEVRAVESAERVHLSELQQFIEVESGVHGCRRWYRFALLCRVLVDEREHASAASLSSSG